MVKTHWDITQNEIFAICNNMGCGSGDYYTEVSHKTNIVGFHLYLESSKEHNNRNRVTENNQVVARRG